MDLEPRKDRKARSPLGSYPLVVSMVGATLLAILTLAVTTRQNSIALPTIDTPGMDSASSQIPRDVVRAAFFDTEVEPRIAETDRLNHLAAQRCIDRITELIRRY